MFHKNEENSKLKKRIAELEKMLKELKSEAGQEEVKGTEDLTELVFILDRSGSMSGLEEDTIGGFNSMIEKQKKEEGKCLVSTVLFDHCSQVLHDRVDLKKIDPMTRKDYTVRGSTALVDALGGAIEHMKKVHRYVRKEDVPARVMFIITTDGMENASHIYSSDTVKRMIEEQKKKGWEFIFLGANIDAVETAKQYGIDEDRAVTFISDKKGTRLNYKVVAEAVTSYRARASVDDHWMDEIKEDVKSRK